MIPVYRGEDIAKYGMPKTWIDQVLSGKTYTIFLNGGSDTRKGIRDSYQEVCDLLNLEFEANSWSLTIRKT